MKYVIMVLVVGVLGCSNSGENTSEQTPTGMDTLPPHTDSVTDSRVDKTEVDPARKDTLTR
jgi:hypothetical protein